MAQRQTTVIKAKIHEFFDKAIAKLKVVGGEVWDFLYPFIQLFMSEMGQAVAQAAMVAVTECAATMGEADGQEKRKAAYDKMVAILAAKGITVGASVIYAAIEAAVQRIKYEEGK